MWITLDNQAVVDGLNRLMNGSLGKKVDDVGIWNALRQPTKDRAEAGELKVTWSKDHAKEEDIASGKSTLIEKERSDRVDLLADEGRKQHDGFPLIAKAARQWTQIALLMQTQMVNIWNRRRQLLEEKASAEATMHDEVEAVKEVEANFESEIIKNGGQEAAVIKGDGQEAAAAAKADLLRLESHQGQRASLPMEASRRSLQKRTC